MRRLMLTAVIVGAALIPLAACGDDDDGSDATSATAGGTGTTTAPAGTGGGAAGDATITITELAFPPQTRLAAGGTVSVINETGSSHTVTDLLGTFDEQVAAGETVEIVIEEPGDYEYVCNIHPQMMGVINVE